MEKTTINMKLAIITYAKNVVPGMKNFERIDFILSSVIPTTNETIVEEESKKRTLQMDKTVKIVKVQMSFSWTSFFTLKFVWGIFAAGIW